ncbi:MAG: gliding motility-associated C-terminal domain-containing protein [Bacteroidetes bacterium]|nr:gliding motility-associated C-terminal domain-containing protein [Bacteroidota bacterium]
MLVGNTNLRFLVALLMLFGARAWGTKNIKMDWSTYVGSTQSTSYSSVRDMAIDNAGNIYCTGYYEGNFPVTDGSVNKGGQDVFIYKLDPTGSNLIWSISIGDVAHERGNGITIDHAGNIYITGFTYSPNFPTTAGAYNQNLNLGVNNPLESDAFVMKLDNSGNIIYSTFIGGIDTEAGDDIKVNAAGEAIVYGLVTELFNPNSFPTTFGAYDSTYNGGQDDIVIFKLNSTGSSLQYSTYIGGDRSDGSAALSASFGTASTGKGLYIDAASNIYITGYTLSKNFPTTSGCYDAVMNTTTTAWKKDVVICKLNPSGNGASDLVWSTYLGGDDDEYGIDLTLNSAQEVVVTGVTYSANFPTTPGVYGINRIGSTDAFISILSNSGSMLLRSTHYGALPNWGAIVGSNIKCDANDNLFICGFANFQSGIPNLCSGTTIVSRGMYVAKLNVALTSVLSSNVYGTNGQSLRHSMEYKSTGCDNYIVIAHDAVGQANPLLNPNFLTTSGAYQTSPPSAGKSSTAVFKLIQKSNVGFVTSSGTIANCSTPITFTDTTSQCNKWDITTSYMWDFGDGNTSSATTPTHSYLTPGTYSVKMKVACPLDSVTLQITVASPTLAAGILTNDTTLCDGSSLILSSTGGQNYSWQPSIGLNATNTATVLATPTTSATYYLAITTAQGCILKDSIAIAMINAPQIIVNGVSGFCAGDSTQLIASNASGYLWSTASTNVAITVVPVATTTYTLFETSGVCNLFDTATITVHPDPLVSIVLPTSSVCVGETITLTANGNGIAYSWAPANTLSVSSGTTTIASPTISTTYSVQALSAFGCTATTTVSIQMVQPPVVSLSSNTTICNGASVSLSVSGGTNYLWNNGSSNTSITVSPLANAVYTVSVSNGSCTSVDSVLINVLPMPTISLSPNQTICSSQAITLTASGGTTYLWSTGETTTSIVVSPATTSIYSASVYNSNCITSGSVTIVISQPIADAGVDITLTEGESATLNATGGISYNWIPISNSSCANCQTTVVTPSVSTMYYVTVTDAYGCSAMDSVFILIDASCSKQALFVPNAFSPNGDGQNDVLKIYGTACVKKLLFTIYNRWGEKIIETEDINFEWDGVLKNKNADTGVYVYKLISTTTKNQNVSVSGNITLVR